MKLHESNTQGSFSEFVRLSDGGIAVLAPHGGQVEPNTDIQAELLAQVLDVSVDIWGTRGIIDGGYNKAYNRWHTTSESHSLSEFQLYQRLADNEYSVAVSFHAMGGDGVIVGGRATHDERSALARVLESKLPGDTVVSVAEQGDKRAGMSDNFVNSLETDTSVHIEQSLDVVSNHTQCVVESVREWIQSDY